MGRFLVNLLALGLLVSIASASSRADIFEESKCFRDLKPKGPKVAWQSDGGKIEVWGSSYPAMKDANVAAARMTLKPGGLLMPAYVDIPALKLVIQGNVTVGVINPMTAGKRPENTYQLKQGDVVALPAGVASWWLNTGAGDAVVVCVGDTSASTASEEVFFLAGGRSKSSGGAGGVARGFSPRLLAQAWETSEGVVKSIVNNQEEGGLITLPAPPQPSAAAGDNSTTRQARTQKYDLVYHYADAEPDVSVENGGEVRELNSLKMSILKYMGLGAECVRLNKGAMVAPNWFLNAHQVVYVKTGCGKLQVINNMGDRVLDMDAKEGGVVLIPKGFPWTIVAGPDGLQFVSVVTSNTPVVSFLAGSNSVYNAMPAEIVSAIFKIDPDTTRVLQQSQSKASIIIPPKPSSQS